MNHTNAQNRRESSPQEAPPLEVEQKYRVASHDAILAHFAILNISELALEEQCDIYLKHPCHDFAVTGEAFRIRLVNDAAVVTYKGARLPGPVKTRSEIEIPLAIHTDREWLQILLALGFCEVARIRKRRRLFEITLQSETFKVALDDVEGLGKFVEIEAIVNDRGTLPRIQAAISEVAAQLQVDQVEPRSYLRQLLELDRD